MPPLGEGVPLLGLQLLGEILKEKKTVKQGPIPKLHCFLFVSELL